MAQLSDWTKLGRYSYISLLYAAGYVRAVAGFSDAIKTREKWVNSHGATRLHVMQLFIVQLTIAFSVDFDSLR
ncbi:MAG: hypothetical protein IH951_13785 [Bacteroidetes bacterium]|nr:hypothetical protein [Bacteroidota bacterium]